MKNEDDVFDVKNSKWTNTGFIMFPDDQPMSYFEELKLEYDKIKAVERYSYASYVRVIEGCLSFLITLAF